MECYGSQAATDSKVPHMSPRKAGKPTKAATLGRRAAHRTPATPGGDAAQLQKGHGSERAAATAPPRPRAASAPRVGRSRDSDPPPFDDPSNYLG
jgi:hypothetical protein